MFKFLSKSFSKTSKTIKPYHFCQETFDITAEFYDKAHNLIFSKEFKSAIYSEVDDKGILIFHVWHPCLHKSRDLFNTYLEKSKKIGFFYLSKEKLFACHDVFSIEIIEGSKYQIEFDYIIKDSLILE